MLLVTAAHFRVERTVLLLIKCLLFLAFIFFFYPLPLIKGKKTNNVHPHKHVNMERLQHGHLQRGVEAACAWTQPTTASRLRPQSWSSIKSLNCAFFWFLATVKRLSSYSILSHFRPLGPARLTPVSFSPFTWCCNEKMICLVQLEEAAWRPGPFKPIISGWRRRGSDWEVFGGSPGLALLQLLFVSSWPSALYRLRSCKTQDSHRENMKRKRDWALASLSATWRRGRRGWWTSKVLTCDVRVDT